MQGNKLIAEFMGWELEETLKGQWVYAIRQNVLHPTREYEETNFYLPQELYYHKSWDWLMPVVEKIGKMNNFLFPFGLYKNLVLFEINMSNGCALIKDMYGDNNVPTIEYYSGPLIDNVYNAVVEFIKWYNTQPNKAT